MEIQLHILSGFLGSGKTTAIQLAAQLLKQKGVRPAVITNDQGMNLVDSVYFKSQGIPVRQVINGCFCCQFSKLSGSLESLVKLEQPDVIFAESVGTCTDLVATVIRPLRQFHPGARVSFSVFADAPLLWLILNGQPTPFEEQVRYLYLKQLEEASLIIVNKVDLVSVGLLQEIRQLLEEKYAEKDVLFQNSLDESSVQSWLDTLDYMGGSSWSQSLDLDYSLYAEGEASLAWLDQEVELFSPSHDAVGEAIRIMQQIHDSIREAGFPIGHLKCVIDETFKISFTQTEVTETELHAYGRKSGCRLLINARVQTEPSLLDQLVKDCMDSVTERFGTRILPLSHATFRPGYPRPEHRFVK
jgi:G3E family GTPase